MLCACEEDPAATRAPPHREVTNNEGQRLHYCCSLEIYGDIEQLVPHAQLLLEMGTLNPNL